MVLDIAFKRMGHHQVSDFSVIVLDNMDFSLTHSDLGRIFLAVRHLIASSICVALISNLSVPFQG